MILKFSSEDLHEILDLRIYSSGGKLIKSEEIWCNNELIKNFDVSAFPKGLYFISIKGTSINITKEFLIY
jgi:hypothetical protein